MPHASLHVLPGLRRESSFPAALPGRYFIALLAVASAAAIRGALDPLLDTEAPMLVFVAPTVMSAVFLGTGAGIFATLLSTAVGTYFFIEPKDALWALAMPDRVRLALFLAENLVIVALIGAWRAKRVRPPAEPTTQLLNT